LAKQVSNVM